MTGANSTRQEQEQDFFIRPTYQGWGIFQTIGPDRARKVWEGKTEDECRAKLKEGELP